MELQGLKYLVVGAGFFGCVIAERIAGVLGERVLVIDKRDHIGGNCFSDFDPETGILYHVYGTHIFHTSDREVWDYINRFTEFNGYHHQVLTTYQGRVYQFPINLDTINGFYGTNLRPYEVDGFLGRELKREGIVRPGNFEEKAISIVGRPLYEALIKGYTQKQWQRDPAELPAEILTRLPFRKNYNDSYYHSRWQGVPLNGYVEIFTKMLSSDLIDVMLNKDFFEIRDLVPGATTVIYSGPIDRLFNFSQGKLSWRSLRFEQEVKSVDDYQGTAVMNFADLSVPHTRIHEPKHLHPERTDSDGRTLIIKEFPTTAERGDPLYPVEDRENIAKLALYRELHQEHSGNIIIGGRLGDYKYLDMHQTIRRALDAFTGRILKT